MKISKILIIFFLSYDMIACNKSLAQKQKPTTINSNTSILPPAKSRVRLPTEDMNEDLLLYPNIKDMLNNNRCIESSSCPTITVEAGNAEIKNNQIMILEELHIPHSTFSRYRDRISGFYSIGVNGLLKRLRPTAKVSNPYIEIMDILNNDRKSISRTIPSLGAYLAEHSQFEFISGNVNSLDHAATVFELLVDKNPDTNFVMAGIPELTNNERCDSIENSETALKSITMKFENAAKSLLEIIKQHQVKTINVSYLSTVQSELEHMRRTCKKQDYNIANKIFQIKTKFFLNIIENSDVVIVQAVPNDDTQSYYCPFHRRWIRVGYVNVPKSNIPDEGIPLTDENLPNNLRPVSNCITVAINSGITDKLNFAEQFPSYYDENSLFRNYDGLYAYPVDVMATSWATPLALSFIRANLQGKIKKPPQFVYTTVINRILDPIKNKQFIQND